MRSTVIFGCCLLIAGSFGLNAQEPGAQPSADAAQAPAAQNSPASPGSGQSPATQKPTTTAASAPSAQELANQVNNPAAPVTFIQFRDILAPNVAGANGVANSLQMQPVLPIGPFKSFPWVQLVKLTMPLYEAIPGTVNLQKLGVTGVGDLQVLDLITVKQSWGRWGFGPALVFPTASSRGLGAGKYQIGPSVALIYTGVKNLTVGAVVQNPISYAGDPKRPSVNNMIITPTFTFNLKEGWFVGLSDYNWTFNWEHGGTAAMPLGVSATFPLGLQVGKVVTLGRQPVSLSVEAGGVAVRPAGSPNPGWILGFELSPIFNFHVGPGEKIKVRKQD